MEESSWSSIFSQLDKDTFAKVQSALDSLKEVSDTPEEKLSEDPTTAISELNAKLNKIIKGLKAHRGRFKRIENRLSSIESKDFAVGGSVVSASVRQESPNAVIAVDVGGGIKPKKKRQRKLKTMAQPDDIKDDKLKERKR